jgi:hypothetical protein
MSRFLLSIVLNCIVLTLACTKHSDPLAGGGGIETVALVIPLPESMRGGGSVVYGDTTIALAPGAASVTIEVPQADSIASVAWISGIDTIVLGTGLSAPGGLAPKIVLLVTGSVGARAPADSLIRAHIIKEGIVVIPVTDSQVSTSDTQGTNGVCIAATVSLGSAGARFRNAAVPVVDCNYLLLDSLGLCGPVSGTDFGSRHPADTVFVNPNRPGSAGLFGPSAFFSTLSDTLGHLDWARPVAGASLTAVDPLDTTHAQSFCVETGATLMGGGLTSARRAAFLFWPYDAPGMTSQAKQVFRAIVRWTFLRD